MARTRVSVEFRREGEAHAASRLEVGDLLFGKIHFANPEEGLALIEGWTVCRLRVA